MELNLPKCGDCGNLMTLEQDEYIDAALIAKAKKKALKMKKMLEKKSAAAASASSSGKNVKKKQQNNAPEHISSIAIDEPDESLVPQNPGLVGYHWRCVSPCKNKMSLDTTPMILHHDIENRFRKAQSIDLSTWAVREYFARSNINALVYLDCQSCGPSHLHRKILPDVAHPGTKLFYICTSCFNIIF